MSTGSAKLQRRKIRKALGPAAEVFAVAHEEGLKAHGEMLRVVILGPFWRRWCWLLLGPRITFALFRKRDADGNEKITTEG